MFRGRIQLIEPYGVSVISDIDDTLKHTYVANRREMLASTFLRPFEEVGGRKQGGMCELPLPQSPTGLMRGRFHPTNGHLYTCGMFAWASNQQQPE